MAAIVPEAARAVTIYNYSGVGTALKDAEREYVVRDSDFADRGYITPYPAIAMVKAARRGDEMFLRWWHDKGCPWSTQCSDCMLEGAARGGFEHLCRLARTWGLTQEKVTRWKGDGPRTTRQVPVAANTMLSEAARGGFVELCRLAKTWGAWDFNEMMASAARGGHTYLCRLAKKWGATNYNGMMTRAAEGGYEHLCRLAKEWGAAAYDDMRHAAADKHHARLVDLAEKWAAERRAEIEPTARVWNADAESPPPKRPCFRVQSG
jgi:hypothetical protein